MTKVKPYKEQVPVDMSACEPAVGYQSTYLQGLKSRLVASIEATMDERKLEQCLDLFCQTPMPCQFTDEEFLQELEASEASGYTSHEEVLKAFEKWVS